MVDRTILTVGIMWLYATVNKIIPKTINPLYWFLFTMKEIKLWMKIMFSKNRESFYLDTIFKGKGTRLQDTKIEDRDRCNLKKKAYYQAVSPDKIENTYRKKIRELLPSLFVENQPFLSGSDHGLLNIYSQLHWGKDSTDLNYEYYQKVASNVGKFSFVEYVKYRFILEDIYANIEESVQEARENLREDTIAYWLGIEYQIEDVTTEIFTNIMSMTINWKNSMIQIVEYMMKNKIAPKTDHQTLHSVLANINTTQLKASNLTEEDYGQCPYNERIEKDFYHSHSKTVVPRGVQLIEDDQLCAFGKGEKRCIGELLTLAFMEEFINYVNAKNIKFTKGNASGKVTVGLFKQVDNDIYWI
jgi:hypothetical protein